MPGVVTMRFSDKGYTSGQADSVPSTYFEPRALQPLFFTQGIIGSERVAGFCAVSGGYVDLDNSDGGLDDLLFNHAIDGRRVVVKVGAEGAAYDDFETVFDGLAVGWSAREQKVTIELRDALADLDLPIQANNYAGSGGLEGGTDLTGKLKPVVFGLVRGTAPPLVDSASLIYDCHDGAVQDVLAVFDRGIAITEVGGAPAAGQFQQDLANGNFKLGGTPAGTVTADVRAGSNPAGFLVVLDQVLTKAGIATTKVPTFDRQNFPLSASIEVGVWVSVQSRSRRAVLNDLLATVGGYLAPDRVGMYRIGVFSTPGGAPEFTLTDAEIISIEQELPPRGVYPPNWRRRVGYKQNYTVQTDLAAAVTAAQRDFAREEFRVVTSEDAAVLTQHLYATDPDPVESLFDASSAASDEAARLLALYKTERRIYRILTKHQIFEYRMGQPGHITYPRWDLESGKDVRVISVDVDAARNQAVLRVFA